MPDIIYWIYRWLVSSLYQTTFRSSSSALLRSIGAVDGLSKKNAQCKKYEACQGYVKSFIEDVAGMQETVASWWLAWPFDSRSTPAQKSLWRKVWRGMPIRREETLRDRSRPRRLSYLRRSAATENFFLPQRERCGGCVLSQ